MLKIFLFILIMFAVACVILSLLFLPEICEWIEDKREERKEHQYIDFKSFSSFYKMNPDRWELKKDYVKFFNGYNVCREMFKTNFYTDLHFNFKDRKKYKKWKCNIEKQKWQIKNIETLNEILSVVKQDIHKFEKENEARMNKATNNIDEIIARIHKEI